MATMSSHILDKPAAAVAKPVVPTPEGVQGLVEEGRVHSAIFTRPEIFELEIEQIFHRTWLYIGHESEVPKEGDFKLRTMGRQPVIMVRGKGGDVNVFLNRCRHRGGVIAEKECGNAKFFKCWWHGWIYDNNGALVEIPRDDAYEPGFKAKIGGLSRPPRVDNYRGLIFASLDADVPDLREHLGLAADMLDYLVDASPDGEIVVDSGDNKTYCDANWKFVGMDGYHVETVHASVLAIWAEKANDGVGATHRGDSTSDKTLARARDFGHGHVALDYRAHRMAHLDEYLEFLGGIPGGTEYIEAMRAKHGEKRGNELLAMAGDPHIGIYPNMQIVATHIRIVNPISADKTQVVMLPVTLKGVPASINQTRLRQHESFYGPTGAGSPDDAEVFERAQRGLHATVDPWIDISRGLHREKVDDDGSIVGLLADEVTQRGQAREWLRLMTKAPRA